MELVSKIRKRLTEKGLKAGAAEILDAASRKIVDRNREMIVMSLDLSNPKAHRQKNEKERFDFQLCPIADVYPKAIQMLERSEKWRIAMMETRIKERTPGFAAIENGEVVAYVFYEHNSERPPHPDLEWLGIRLGDDEVYSFDSFVPPELRGRGIAILRATYQALHEKGFRTAKGYVYSWDKAPLWTYRVTGWKEDARVFEHRIGNSFVVVNGALYRLDRFKRTRILSLPF